MLSHQLLEAVVVDPGEPLAVDLELEGKETCIEPGGNKYHSDAKQAGRVLNQLPCCRLFSLSSHITVQGEAMQKLM